MSVDVADWTPLVGQGRESVDTWARLLKRWSEEHRRYHGVGHLSAMLLFINEFADHAEDADAVRLAAWYHDAIYDPRAGDNEDRSAVLAESELPPLGQSGERVAEVVRLVRLTAEHDPAEGDRNGELLNDADLLVLASPPEAYGAYVNAIREEYMHLPDDAFRAGRVAVLDGLLATPRLYRLEALTPLEAAARRNLKAELSLLQPNSAGVDPVGGAEAVEGRPDAAPPGRPGR